MTLDQWCEVIMTGALVLTALSVAVAVLWATVTT